MRIIYIFGKFHIIPASLQTSIAARNLAVRMSKLGLPVDLVTDDLTAPQRVKVLRGLVALFSQVLYEFNLCYITSAPRFSDGKVRVLITAVALNGVYLGEVCCIVFRGFIL